MNSEIAKILLDILNNNNLSTGEKYNIVKQSLQHIAKGENYTIQDLKNYLANLKNLMVALSETQEKHELIANLVCVFAKCNMQILEDNILPLKDILPLIKDEYIGEDACRLVEQATNRFLKYYPTFVNEVFTRKRTINN